MAGKRGGESESFGIQAVEVAGQVFAAVVQCGGVAPLREVARMAGMHPAKVHRYLVSLVRAGWLEQDAAGGDYRIGRMSIAGGLTGLRGLEPMRVAPAILPGLRDKTGETATFAMWTDGGPTVLMLAESTRPVYMNIRVGSVIPMARTALGKIFATFAKSQSVQTLLKKELRDLDAERRDAWTAERESIERTGIATVRGELVGGVHGVAAPVWDHQSVLAAAIGIIGQSTNMTAEAMREAAVHVSAAAREFSQRLGART